MSEFYDDRNDAAYDDEICGAIIYVNGEDSDKRCEQPVSHLDVDAQLGMLATTHSFHTQGEP